MTTFNDIKHMVSDLHYTIQREDAAEGVLIIENPAKGIRNLVLDCEGSILIIEQLIFELKSAGSDVLKQLLAMNRTMVHGAFALDDTSQKIIWRDTLELENLDQNELDASIKALELTLAEHLHQLIRFAKG